MSITVSSSGFPRKFGRLRIAAHRQPVLIKHRGRNDVVLISFVELQDLLNRAFARRRSRGRRGR